MITPACITTIIADGKNEHKITPAPKNKADSPRFFVPKHIEIHRPSLYFIHKKSKRHIYSNKNARKDAITIKPPVKDIYIPAKPFHLTADKELEFGGVLPDYSPDILALIKVECKPEIESVKVSAGKCVADGRADFKLLYATGYNGKIRSAEFSKQFSHTFDCPSGLIDPICRIRPEVSYVGCKTPDVRSPLLKAHIRLDCEMRGNVQIRCIDAEGSGNYFFKTNECILKRRMSPVSASGECVGEITLGRAENAANEVISHCIRLQPPRISVQENGILLRGDATVTVLYEPENADCAINAVTRSVPIALEIQMPLPENADSDCEVDLISSSVTLMPDNYGENRLFKVRMNINAKATSYAAESMVLVEDMFAPKTHIKCDSGNMTYISDETVYTKTLATDIKITPEESFEDILCSSAEFHNISAEKTDGGVHITGTCCAEVLGRVGSGGCASSEQCDNIEHNIPTDMSEGEISDVSVCLLDVSSTLAADGSVNMRITYEVKTAIMHTQNAQFLSSVIKEEPTADDKDGMTAAYYFISADDDLWSIAKRYALNPDSIKKQNAGVFDDNGAVAAGTSYVYIKL